MIAGREDSRERAVYDLDCALMSCLRCKILARLRRWTRLVCNPFHRSIVLDHKRLVTQLVKVMTPKIYAVFTCQHGGQG